MSWYSSDWRFRAPLSIDNISGSGMIDARITIPTAFDAFWADTRADGFDVVVTDSDGVTALTYQRQTWTPASKAGVLEINDWAPNNADCVAVAWVYWGNASAADGSSSFTASSPNTGILQLAAPGAIRVRAIREAPGALKPSQVITKGSQETLHVWADVSPLLGGRSLVGNGSPRLDEVASVQVGVFDGGVSQAAMFEAGASMVIEDRAGRCWVRVRVKAGSSGTDYTLQIKIITTTGETHTPRYLLRVRDVSEA